MTHPPAPDSPHKAVTLPGGSSRVKSSNTICGTRQHTSLKEKRRREREGGGRTGRKMKCCHLLWSSGIGKLDIFKFHSSFNLIGWDGGPSPQWDGRVQGHVFKYSCSSTRTSYHLAKQDGESSHGPEGRREGDGRREGEEKKGGGGEDGGRERGKERKSCSSCVPLNGLSGYQERHEVPSCNLIGR